MALTMPRLTVDRKEGELLAVPVAANTKIYKGGLTCANAAGFAVPGADTAGFSFLGVAYEDCDNTGGANGEKSVRVWLRGTFRFKKSGSITQANVNASLFIVDDETLALAATTTNDVLAGKLKALEGSDVRVRIDGAT
jgi:hypothetical protein